MPWGRSSPTPTGSNEDDGDGTSSTLWTTITTSRTRLPLLQMMANDRRSTPKNEEPSSRPRLDALIANVRAYFAQPHNWIAPTLAAGLSVGLWTFYQRYLRRIPGSDHIAPSFFRRRSLLGTVTSVGDGDGFHMFHTPGGRLAGWGWLRRVPRDRKELKGRTISVRIAGIDAPEGAHFGKPAQPYAAEAQTWLESYILGRRVRARIYRRDQYERVVATVHVRRPLVPFLPFPSRRRDVGLEMLHRGLATTYEGKIGAEFGGDKMERRYKEAEEEARRRGRGMWAVEKTKKLGGGLKGLVGKKGEVRVVESPMAYKRRMKMLEGAAERKNEGKSG
ncbi:hypothetical protein VTK26DRAFT_8579 [Humicola hyalothermophila]